MYLAQGTRPYDQTLLPQCLCHVTALFHLHAALKVELLFCIFPILPSCLLVVISFSNLPSLIIVVLPLFNTMTDHKTTFKCTLDVYVKLKYPFYFIFQEKNYVQM